MLFLLTGGNPILHKKKKKKTATSELSPAPVPWDSEWNGRDFVHCADRWVLVPVFFFSSSPSPSLAKTQTHSHTPRLHEYNRN